MIDLSESDGDAVADGGDFDDDNLTISAKDDGPLKSNKTGDKPDDEEIKLELETSKKKRKLMKPFNEDLLISRDALTRIYEDFPRAIHFKGRGNEAHDVNRLVGMYREWAFQLHSGINFFDVINKIEKLGPKGRVRSHMELMRETERTRYLKDVMGISNYQNSSNNQQELDESAINGDRNDIDSTIINNDIDGRALPFATSALLDELSSEAILME